jgi:carboxylesterase type B
MVYIKRAITIALGLVVAFNILANYAFGESVASEPSLLREEHTREPTMVINVDGLGSTRGIVRNDVVEFMGLPYAKPPTGQLRWKAPILQDEPWDGVYDANRYVICVQPPYTFGGFHPVEMIEDCLRLNIWAPKELLETKPSERKLWPVIVYMHGGMFAFGSGVDRYINGTAFIKVRLLPVSRR